MAAKQFHHSYDIADRATARAYPATCTGVFAKIADDGTEVHEIWCTADPSAIYPNAPNGSTFIDTTNKKFYFKSGDLGDTDGDITATN